MTDDIVRQKQFLEVVGTLGSRRAINQARQANTDACDWLSASCTYHR